MKLEQSFTVAAPIDEVWSALIDVERIAPCLPGAEITGQGPDGSYEGTFSVKLGPTTAGYRGSLKMESLDEAQHVATMSAKGTDKRGQGGANATIVSRLGEEGDVTRVDVDTDFTITGRLARFGRSGMIEDISKRLLREFAQCLETTLGSQPSPGPAAAAPLPGAAASEEPASAVPPPTVSPTEGADAPAAPERVAPEPDEVDAALASAGGAAGEATAAADVPPAVPPQAPSGGPTAPEPPAAPPTPQERGSVPPPSAAPRPAPRPAKPISGFSLFFSVLLERIRRLASRGRKG
jgi:carbon monoxide dehydrogenase subunit G